MIDIVVGLQWGDEGKGKITDAFADDYDYVVRYQGGSNAGHTVYIGEEKYVTHSIPTGVLHPKCKGVITHGCVINPEELIKEIKDLENLGIELEGRLFVSEDCHVITRSHLIEDEENKKIYGSTGKGIGPAYRDKVYRKGIRLGELDIPELEPYVCDTRSILYDAHVTGKKILLEGAQAVMLDIELGTYPFVTSAPCTANYAPQGTGLPLKFFGDSSVVGVFKAYTTRIGTGPFPSEIKNEELVNYIREHGQEYGATTGRPRRIGWLDIDQLYYACEVNGVVNLVMTKVDTLSGLDEVCIKGTLDYYHKFDGWNLTGEETCYDDLDFNLKTFICFIELATGANITNIGVGPARHQLIDVVMRKDPRRISKSIREKKSRIF